MIRAILFDCWGTILHAPRLMTREAAIESFHHILTEMGYDLDFQLFHEAYLKEAERQHEEARVDYRELDYVERLYRVLEAVGLRGDKRGIAQRMWRRYLEEWPRQSLLDPEAPKLLRRLRRRYKLALVTNFPDIRTARMVFNIQGLPEFFDAIVVSAEVGYRKPSSIIFQRALEELGVDPSAAVMVGDTVEADIQGAARLGMKTILIVPERVKAKEPVVANTIISSLGDLEKNLRMLERQSL
jgi:putative hydrolase of the HAD superfamily